MRFFKGLIQKVKANMFFSLGVSTLVFASAMLGLWTPDLDRAELEKKYATPHTQFADIGGYRVHYHDSGPKDAPILLMLHGFGSSLQTWDAWAESLNKQYRVVRLDLPGFGLTGPQPDELLR